MDKIKQEILEIENIVQKGNRLSAEAILIWTGLHTPRPNPRH